MALLTIIADNKVGPGMGAIAEHGFCAHIKTDDIEMLWDTGQGFCLKNNPARMGIDLAKISAAALSHGHYDHTGGLEHALRSAGGLDVFCHPVCFENKKVEREFMGKKVVLNIGMPKGRDELEQSGAVFRLVEDEAEIAPGLRFMTGVPMKNSFEKIEPGFFIEDDKGRRPDEFHDDAFLAVETDKGLSVILGCAHRGMINTLWHVMDRMGVDKLHSVWGGTHMMDQEPWQVEAAIEILRDMDIEIIGAGHCTGFANEAELQKAFPGKFVHACVGTRVEL